MSVERFRLADGYEGSRIIKGGWHLAGGHGAIDADAAVADMARFVEAGVTTFDCADIYTGVEALIGRFLGRRPDLAPRVGVHTKFVPDLADLAVVDGAYVERIIDRSIARLGVERLDLVQFHWWDYAVPGLVETALELDRLRRAGKIARIGVTNFNTDGLLALLDAGVPVVSNQVQYSLLDARPAARMAGVCAERGVALFCYGTVAGGFLSERWLGVADPGPEHANRSLVKYKLIIDDFGGWDVFQALLEALAEVARRRGADIASVATRAVLERPSVAAAIVGATSARWLSANAAVCGLRLEEADFACIEGALKQSRPLDGDVYDLERDRTGRHGRIMKYELNKT